MSTWNDSSDSSGSIDKTLILITAERIAVIPDDDLFPPDAVALGTTQIQKLEPTQVKEIEVDPFFRVNADRLRAHGVDIDRLLGCAGMSCGSVVILTESEMDRLYTELRRLAKTHKINLHEALEILS